MPASRKKPTKKTPCSHRPRVTNSKGTCRLRKSCAGKPRSLYKVKNPRKNCKNSRRYKKKSRPRRKSKSKCKSKPSIKKGKLGKKRKTEISSEDIKAANSAQRDAEDAVAAARAAELAGLEAAVDSKNAVNAAVKARADALAIADDDTVMQNFKKELEKVYNAARSGGNSTYTMILPVAQLAGVNLVANSSETTNLDDKAEGAAALNLINKGLNYAIKEPLEKWTLAQERFMTANPMEDEVLGKFQTLLKSYSIPHIVALSQGKM